MTGLVIGGLAAALLTIPSGPASASSNGQVVILAGVPAAQVREIALLVNPPEPPTDPEAPAPTPPRLSGLLDIYQGTNLVANDVRAGSLITIRVPTGSRTINVYADGQAPRTDNPLVSQAGVQVNATTVPTVAIGLNRNGRALRTKVYRNQFPASPGAGNAWVVVRNVAATGTVDVRLGGQNAFRGLQNLQQAVITRAPGAAAIRVLGGSNRSTTIARNDNFSVRSGRANIIYIWGSESAGNVRIATQTVNIG